MPELPEVEAIRRKLAPRLKGKRIRGVHILRASVTKPQPPPLLQELATGRTVRKVYRRGKNLFVELSGGYTIRVHLRMTGDLYLSRAVELPASVRLWLELGGGGKLVFDDRRALGTVHVHSPEEVASLLSKLGPEPLSKDFTPERLAGAARRSSRPAKLFLMDQARVAGLGNIYAAEALHRAGIDPRKPARRIRPAQAKALHSAIVAVLRDAVKSATTTYTRPGDFGETESFPRVVYGREGEPCPVCGGRIRRIGQGGRSTYFCPACQK
jgi:formamidopyrimidine-DNA glycosylase